MSLQRLVACICRSLGQTEKANVSEHVSSLRQVALDPIARGILAVSTSRVNCSEPSLRREIETAACARVVLTSCARWRHLKHVSDIFSLPDMMMNMRIGNVLRVPRTTCF